MILDDLTEVLEHYWGEHIHMGASLQMDPCSVTFFWLIYRRDSNTATDSHLYIPSRPGFGKTAKSLF